MKKPLLSCLLLLVTNIGFTSAAVEEPQNLVKNPGWESDLSPSWEKRTPDDAERKLDRAEGESHSGRWCLVLENRQATATRLRQGSDRSLKIPAGSLVELSAWIKMDMADGGKAGVQLYSMDDKGQILAQPRTDVSGPKGQWRQIRQIGSVPQGTAYSMVYLQIDKATGKALFDDVQLRVVRGPRPAEPATKIALLTDLAESDECYQNLKQLLGDGLVKLNGQSMAERLAGCEGAAVLLRSASVSPDALKAIADFAGRGGSVFMDLGSFARWQEIPTEEIRLAAPTPSGSGQSSYATIADRMQVGLKVVKASQITAGFDQGQIVPYAGTNGKLVVLAKVPAAEGVDVLATAAGKPAVVQVRLGKGRVVAADMLSLGEPYFNSVAAYYKYLFLANTLARPDRVMLAEYYPRKLTYAEMVELMRQMARRYPALRFQEEGPACGQYKLCSLNIGREGAPLYFLYAATHGSEWEPGYGLLTLARHLAEGRLRDAIDLDKACVKIIPTLNPWGYDERKRQNANGVDLNRNGDHHWEQYQGRDSTGDGRYGPGDYDWKGASPFSEPETQTYRRIIQAPNLYCTLDLHGNTSATSNKVAIMASTAREDNPWRVADLQDMVNRRLRMRYLLRQTDEKGVSPYLLERINRDQERPVLQNAAARGRYGLLVELTAGYANSYGTVLQTEVTCELCRALFQAFPPPAVADR